jgi:c-di-AMP phosphodiesterase-like protein
MQHGGAKQVVVDMVKKYTYPLEMYVMLVQIMAIVYVRLIPSYIAYQASTVLGRLFLFLVTLTVANLYSWVTALLMAVFSVLLLAVAPRTKEGFASNIDIKLIDQKKKWFIEQALGENPVGIEEDKVRTQAIQDGSNGSSSTTSSK